MVDTVTPPDWLSQQFLRDPYPQYRAMREREPVFYDAPRRRWILTRYEDVITVLRDNERFSAELEPATSMLVTDPPDHTRLRSLVSKAFTPRAVQALVPRIESIIDELLTAVRDEAGMDVIAQFAYPLPITVIAELLGVEAERQEFFRAVAQDIAYALGAAGPGMIPPQAGERRNQLFAYFNELIGQRRKEPRDDLVTALIGAEDDSGSLTHQEVLSMLLLLLVGGHETTVNLVANGLLALLRDPQAFEQLRAQPDLATQAVEELLRYDAPVQYSGRVCARDTELSGAQIRRGDKVRVMLGAANRDPEVFESPDELQLERAKNPHVAFGVGIHVCLGAPLARVEAAMALPALLHRFPSMRLDGELRYRPATVLRGLEALPVRF